MNKNKNFYFFFSVQTGTLGVENKYIDYSTISVEDPITLVILLFFFILGMITGFALVHCKD